MRVGVFLDRDGTINEEVGYLHETEKLIVIPGAARAIKRLNDHGMPVVCVSNQSGVARGLYSIDAVCKVNQRLEDLLKAKGAHLDMILFCPHHPTEGRSPYKKSCSCRKPGPGMLEKAATELEIDLARSYLIGDCLSDIHAARAAGLKAILVLTGYGREEMENIRKYPDLEPDHICPDIVAGIDWILKQEGLNSYKSS